MLPVTSVLPTGALGVLPPLRHGCKSQSLIFHCMNSEEFRVLINPPRALSSQTSDSNDQWQNDRPVHTTCTFIGALKKSPLFLFYRTVTAFIQKLQAYQIFGFLGTSAG